MGEKNNDIKLQRQKKVGEEWTIWRVWGGEVGVREGGNPDVWLWNEHSENWRQRKNQPCRESKIALAVKENEEGKAKLLNPFVTEWIHQVGEPPEPTESGTIRMSGLVARWHWGYCMWRMSQYLFKLTERPLIRVSIEEISLDGVV